MHNHRKLRRYGCTFIHVSYHISTLCNLIMPFVFITGMVSPPDKHYFVLGSEDKQGRHTYSVRTGPSWGQNPIGHKESKGPHPQGALAPARTCTGTSSAKITKCKYLNNRLFLFIVALEP